MPLHMLFAGLAMLALFVFGVTGWANALIRRLRGEPLLPLEPRQPAPWTLLDLLVVLGAFVLIQVAAALAVRAALGGEISLENAGPRQLAALVLAQGVANLATLAVAAAVVLLRARATMRDLGFSSAQLASDVALGVSAFFMLALPVLLLQGLLTQWYPSEHPLVKMLRESPNSLLFAICVFVAVIVAPVAEEFFFRVLLQGWLEKATGRPSRSMEAASLSGDALPFPGENATTKTELLPANPYQSPVPERENGKEIHGAEALPDAAPPYWPIFVSAAVFALMHFSHGPDPIPLFLLAIGLGYLYRQTHRIAPCITVHFLLNALSMTMLWMELTFGK